MDNMKILLENMEFASTVYNFKVLMFGFAFLVLLNLILKGWSMWRAARMGMKTWFVALLLVNSMGILPLFFLAMTKKRYQGLQNPQNSQDGAKESC